MKLQAGLFNLQLRDMDILTMEALDGYQTAAFGSPLLICLRQLILSNGDLIDL